MLNADYEYAVDVFYECGDTKALEAVLRNRPELVHLLSYNHPQSFLIHGAAEKYPHAIPILIKLGADVNQLAGDSPGYTPLHTALSSNAFDSLKVLLAHGADPNIPDASGATPLQIIISSPYYNSATTAELAELFLHYGADPNRLDKSDCTSLDVCYFTSNDYLFRLLRQAGARQAYEYTALALSILEDDIESLESIFQHGFDLNEYDQYGDSALHIAAAADNLRIAQFLIDRGADVNIRRMDYDEQTKSNSACSAMPIHIAAQKLNADMVSLLIAHGADVNAPFHVSDDSQFDPFPLWSALAYVSTNNREQAHKTIRTLLENGANINVRSKTSAETALLRVAWLGRKEEVALLLEYGAGENSEVLLKAMQVSASDYNGETLLPLWNAGRRLEPPLTLLDTLPRIGSSIWSIYWKDEQSVNDEQSVDVNESDRASGETPLLWEIRNIGGPLPINSEQHITARDVEWLLKFGADPNLRDRAGNSPLSVARERNLPEVIAFLQQYGATD